jgi:hypothetical protein
LKSKITVGKFEGKRKNGGNWMKLKLVGKKIK